ncbi:4-hydroxyphenylpyruvate dioxygenase [Lactuca sativa]|nr:4-hydroxyphenylpyruvate dioxygenase [Lactuca sativa]
MVPQSHSLRETLRADSSDMGKAPELLIGNECAGKHHNSPAMEFNPVDYNNLIQTNPMSDLFSVRRFHHVEFWCSDATNTSRRFSSALGMPLVAKSDLSTGNTTHASYLLRSDQLLFLFTAPYSATISTNTPSIPTFSHTACRAFTASHGLAVRSIAIEVDDADLAYYTSLSHGAKPSSPPITLGERKNAVVLAEVQLFNDVVLRYISYKQPTIDIASMFLPGFESIKTDSSSHSIDFGIRRLDHVAGNFPELAPVINYLKFFTGFHEFAGFTAKDVGTSESGMNSMILASNNEKVIIGVNEPVYGTKRRSQIQTFLEHNEGPGIQHLALQSEDIFQTLREMKRRSVVGGFEFMPPPPPTYYRNLKNRAADVLSDEQMNACEEFGILVDRDNEGTLLQIFTKPLGDRPTIFIEIIQRIGCMISGVNMQQKPGCGGFGKGNISELFKSIEEYEKTFEAQTSDIHII